MCGIAGAIGNDSEALVKKMLETIRHRGPDGAGIYNIGDTKPGSVLLKITGDKHHPLTDGGTLM